MVIRRPTDQIRSLLIICAVLASSVDAFGEGKGPRAHEGRTLELVVAPDGRTVVSCGSEGMAKVWETESRRLLRTHRGGEEAINALAMTADGRWVATGGQVSRIQVWSPETGEVVAEFPKPGPPESIVASMSFSPDGELLAYGGQQCGVGILSVSRKKTVTRLDPACELIIRVRFDPAGARLAATCSDHCVGIICGGKDCRSKGDHAVGSMFLWEPPYSAPPAHLPGHHGGSYLLDFTRDGSSLVSTGSDKHIRVWDVEKRSERLAIKVGDDFLGMTLAISPDGKTIAWVEETDPRDRDRQWDSILLRDVEGEEARSVPTEHHFISFLEFTPDGGKLVVGSYDGTLEIWDAEEGRLLGAFVDPAVPE